MSTFFSEFKRIGTARNNFVGKGYEFGLNVNNFNDIKEGDNIESFEEIEVKQKLESK